MNSSSGMRGVSRILITICTVIILFMLPSLAMAAQNEEVTADYDIVVMVDGEQIHLADPVRVRDGRLFLPVAEIARLFQATTSWDSANHELTIHTAHGDVIVLGIDVPVVYFNDGRYLMDTAPFILNGRTYVPLRYAAEMLHATVNWIGSEQVVELNKVMTAAVTEERDAAAIMQDYGMSESQLLKRNALETIDSVQAGVELLVVYPSIFDREVEPYTEEDYMLLAKITQVESGYEGYEGQLAVANVILNRVKDSRFPSTIYDVIYSGRQFPPAHNGLLDKSKPNESVLRAAKDALNGKDNVKGAVYFFNPKVSKGAFWSSLDVVKTIGHHRFAS